MNKVHLERHRTLKRFGILIDTLKETVPIWKKEFATDGTYWVDDRP